MKHSVDFEPDELDLIQIALSECGAQLRGLGYSRFLRLEKDAILRRAERMEALASHIRFTGVPEPFEDGTTAPAAMGVKDRDTNIQKENF